MLLRVPPHTLETRNMSGNIVHESYVREFLFYTSETKYFPINKQYIHSNRIFRVGSDRSWGGYDIVL